MATMTRQEIETMRIQAKIAQAEAETKAAAEIRKSNTSLEYCSATARQFSTQAFKPVYQYLDEAEVKAIQEQR